MQYMRLKDKIKDQKTLHGLIVTISSVSVVEALSASGFDWLWIDMEHAPLSLMDVQQMDQAKNPDCAALVRIPINSDEWIQRVLDLGVEGIIVPHVNTKMQAEQVLRISNYPPDGTRSVGLTRASLYGMDTDYAREANTKKLVFVQIEHREGVMNIAEIAQVPDLNGIIIGPYDLAASYGKLGQVQDPEILEAIEHVFATCKRFGKAVGIFAKDAHDAKRYEKQGFQLIAIGIDMKYLWNAAKETLEVLKSEDQEHIVL
jgi:2-dehydro-3-deoxyglucarate aldolase/4-hydroxy-2-oxoheptanedioate aldolase